MVSNPKQPIFTLGGVIPVRRGDNHVKYLTSVTVGRIAELLDSEKIWVDYDYQRGVKVTRNSDGTEKRTPMVDQNRVADIASKILDDELYGGSLTWNLRGNEVDYTYDESSRTLEINDGKPTIPDSNHRHQAILKVYQVVQKTGRYFDMNSYEFPLVIETLDLSGESGLFYEYNQLGKPANPTRSRFINQASLHNRLAVEVEELSKLKGHVEVVSNNLSKNSSKVITFNTLSKGIQEGFPNLDESNFDDIRAYLVEFTNLLVEIRPETGYLPLSERLKVRESSIGDSALIYGAYFKIAGDLKGFSDWDSRLARLANEYTFNSNGESWKGDLMSRPNPIWRQTVLIPTKTGTLSIANRRDSRNHAVEVLQEVVGVN